MSKVPNLPSRAFRVSGNGTPESKVRNVIHGTTFALALFGLVSCQNNVPENKQQTYKNDSLSAVYDTLQSKYDAANAQIDAYATKAANLENLIKQKDAEIAKLNKEKEALLRNNKKLVNELKANKQLISSLRDELSDTTRAFTERLGVIENDRNDLVRQRDSLKAKYNQIVALGSVLHASNIRLKAVQIKRNNKEKDTKRARRADMLRIDFDIDENRIAENGTKKLYLVIKDPSGNLMSSAAVGSGTTTTSNGKTLNYSLLKEVPLVTNEPVKDIRVDWKEEGDYQKGAYSIEIYNGGYRIGGGSVELK